MGLPALQSLEPEKFKRSFGPGYDAGWWAWNQLGGRKDRCNVQTACNIRKKLCERNNLSPKHLQDYHDDLLKKLENAETFEKFGRAVDKVYHGHGHVLIGFFCSTIYRKKGIMLFSEVSARDPIFYRWHQHLEELVQAFRLFLKLFYLTIQSIVLETQNWKNIKLKILNFLMKSKLMSLKQF